MSDTLEGTVGVKIRYRHYRRPKEGEDADLIVDTHHSMTLDEDGKVAVLDENGNVIWEDDEHFLVERLKRLKHRLDRKVMAMLRREDRERTNAMASRADPDPDG